MTRRSLAVALAALTLALPIHTLAQGAEGTDTALVPPTLEIVPAEGFELDDVLWTNRLVVVFADSPNDPRFSEQISLLVERPGPLLERDVIVVTDTDPDAQTDLRRKLRPRGFQMTLIGKDGEVELRKPSPWSVREISHSIDKMPVRKREVREGKAAAG